MKFKIKNFCGLSLMEMVVAIAIFTIAIAGFSLLYVRSLRSNSYTIFMGNSSFAASQGVTKVAEYLRKAREGENANYAIVSASANSLTVYSDFDSDGLAEKLRFFLENGKILMGVSYPNMGEDVTYQSESEVRTIANNIVNGAGDDLFSYYDSTNTQISTAGNINNIRMVKIFLKVNTDPNREINNIEMRTVVELRNLMNL